MRVESVLNEAQDLEWKGYAESRSAVANAAGPQAQNAGIAAAGPGPGVTLDTKKSDPPAAQNTGIAAVGPGPGAQNTGIAAVGPGPGFSPQGAESVDHLPVPPLASVNDLIGSATSE